MSYDEYQPPRTYVGCPVEFAASPTENTRCLGLVARVGKQFVDLLIFHGHNLGYRRHCLHRSDPRCEALPELFKDGDRGVWELAESEKRARELAARLDGMERVLKSMVDDIAALKNPAGQKPAIAEPVARRPHKPRQRKEPVLTG